MSLNVDRQVARQFLELWFHNCPEGQSLEIRPLHKQPPGRPLPQAWVRRGDDPEQAVSSALARVERCVANGDDVYVGVLPRTRESGTQDAVGTRLWIWGDVDYGAVGHNTPALYADRDAALEGIGSCGIQPTAIVDTGGGFHAWWCLSRVPSEVNWKDAIKRLAQAIKADMNALDSPRILRVPGTFNFKNEPAREVRLVEMSGSLVSVDDFLRLPAYVKAEPPPRAKGGASSSGATPGERPFDRANDEPVADVLDWLGIKMHREGARIYCACPMHKGSNASQMVVGGDANVATCFGDCRRHFSPVDLTAAVQRCTPKQAVDMMANRFGFDGFSKRARGSTKPAAETAPAARAMPPRSAGCAAWEAGLARARSGEVRTTLANVECILRCAPDYAGRLRHNEMTLGPELEGAPISDERLTRLRVALEQKWGITPSAQMTDEAVRAVATRDAYHPVRQYLNGLKWDGQERIALVVRDILGAKDEPLTRKLVRAWFISAVARPMEPGCKVDTALVLVGPQGYYKSTFFRVLGSPYFVDTAIDLGSKDAYMQLAKAWIYELPEIDVITSQKHAGQIKGFVTSQYDSFRPPYGRGIVEKPRGCVMVGTTNEESFLTDATGSRRFWVIRVDRPVDIGKLNEAREQLWAEAMNAYRAGERWWLESGEEADREVAADDHCVADPWEAGIVRWLKNPRQQITTEAILEDALSIPFAQQAGYSGSRVGRIMRRLGYDNKRREWIGLPQGGKSRIRVWRPTAKSIEAA